MEAEQQNKVLGTESFNQQCDPLQKVHFQFSYEPYSRQIRLVAIQLQKFWVEVQSLPLFLKIADETSLDLVEHLLTWLKNSPDWAGRPESYLLARMVPSLAQPTFRSKMKEFIRDVRTLRVLKKLLADRMSSEHLNVQHVVETERKVRESLEKIQKYQLGGANFHDLQTKLAEKKDSLQRAQKVRDYFLELGQKTQCPTPHHLDEATEFFRATDFISKIPKEVLGWRLPRILSPHQAVRIQAWQDRARPILETRRRLETQFHLEEKILPTELKRLSSQYLHGGLFQTFTSEYKELEKKYRSLSKLNEKGQPAKKENAAQKAENLLTWANFIEQKEAFETNRDAQMLFDPLFRGIDTDFKTALLTNQWYKELQSTLPEPWVEFILNASQAQLNELVALSEHGGKRPWIESQLQAPEMFKEPHFESRVLHVEADYQELSSLYNDWIFLGLPRDSALRLIEEVKTDLEEYLFLDQRVQAADEVKRCLRTQFKGMDTDLEVIEFGFAYVHFIESSPISPAVKMEFLTLHGPQRLGENRRFASHALATLATTRESLQKLEASSQGQVEFSSTQPIAQILRRMQDILKAPSGLESDRGVMA